MCTNDRPKKGRTIFQEQNPISSTYINTLTVSLGPACHKFITKHHYQIINDCCSKADMYSVFATTLMAHIRFTEFNEYRQEQLDGGCRKSGSNSA